MTLLALAEAVLDVTGSPAPIDFRPLPVDDPVRRCPDITLARQVLHWAPRTPLADGLVKTTQYFRGVLESMDRRRPLAAANVA